MAGHPMLLNRFKAPNTTPTPTTIPSFLTNIIKATMDEESRQRYMKMVHDCYHYANVIHSKLVPGQIFNVLGPWCKKIFDGFACWDDTPPGTIVTQNCPSLVIGFNTKLSAFKDNEVVGGRGGKLWQIMCDENGNWQMQTGSNKSWTDYTSCVDFDDLDFRTTVNKIYVSGYYISSAAILMALAIFMFFRTLQCTRIRIHMQFFTSLILTNTAWIIWYSMVVGDVDVVTNNVPWCQILHILVQYFMMTTYFWMFCEALYLHISLNVVFVKEYVLMKWLKFIGWGIPLIIDMVYAIVRYSDGNTERCWMEMSDTSWIITVPVLKTLLVSFGFIVKVLRVLITKLPPGPTPNRIVATKKAVRAALILIPLFGLHYLLMPLRPDQGSSFEKVYEVVSAIVISLQGLCVSILFCYTNHEVTTAAKAYWARIRNWNSRTEIIPMTRITTGASINTSEKDININISVIHLP